MQRRPPLRIHGVGVRAVAKQRPDHGFVSADGGGVERSPAVLGSPVDVSPEAQQQSHDDVVPVLRRNLERRRAVPSALVDVRGGSVLEQDGHHPVMRVSARGVQRRGQVVPVRAVDVRRGLRERVRARLEQRPHDHLSPLLRGKVQLVLPRAPVHAERCAQKPPSLDDPEYLLVRCALHPGDPRGGISHVNRPDICTPVLRWSRLLNRVHERRRAVISAHVGRGWGIWLGICPAVHDVGPGVQPVEHGLVLGRLPFLHLLVQALLRVGGFRPVVHVLREVICKRHVPEGNLLLLIATGGIVTHGGTLGARNRGAVLVSGCGAK